MLYKFDLPKIDSKLNETRCSESTKLLNQTYYYLQNITTQENCYIDMFKNIINNVNDLKNNINRNASVLLDTINLSINNITDYFKNYFNNCKIENEITNIDSVQKLINDVKYEACPKESVRFSDGEVLLISVAIIIMFSIFVGSIVFAKKNKQRIKQMYLNYYNQSVNSQKDVEPISVNIDKKNNLSENIFSITTGNNKTLKIES